MNKDKRAALQSVRAKARKALAVENAALPKAIVNHLDAVIAHVDKALAAKAKPAANDADDTAEALAA